MPPFRSRPAFTLVVIGIIALLISILLPALNRARASSREIQCAALLRQWGQAWHNYASMNRGAIPNTGDRNRNPIGFYDRPYPFRPWNESGYLYVLPPLMNRKSWNDFPFGQKPTGDIWQCPLADEVVNDGSIGYDPAYYGYHSFGANVYLNYYTGPTSQYGSFLRLARVKESAKTLLMFETVLNAYNAFGQTRPGNTDCNAGFCPDENARSFGDRHSHRKGKLGGNVMTIAGHVEWREALWDPSLPNPEKPPVTDRMWWPY